MTSDELSLRLDDLACDIAILVENLPNRIGARNAYDQIVRAASGASSNYDAARRARSRKEFVAKLGLAVEESDETVGWFSKIVKSRYVSETQVAELRDEARQLRAILAASYATARRNSRERR
jgi:four helix bundle protein